MPEFPSPASTPVAQIRRQFEATATTAAIDASADVAAKMHDDAGRFEPAACKPNADELARASRHDPLSLAVWYYQARCAEASGNAALRESSEKAFAALLRDVFAGVPPDDGRTPLHVESISDGSAIVWASGETIAYSYLDDSDLGAGLFWRVGLRDPENNREHALSFEFVERRLKLVRDDKLLIYPFARLLAERQFVEEGARNPDEGSAMPHRLDYLDGYPADQRSARLKALRASDRLSTGIVLAQYCFVRPEAACAGDAVDALLPFAEKRHAEAMVLLAFARANGIGVQRDEDAAKVLLQSAAKREGVGAAFGAYFDQDHEHAADATPFQRWAYGQVASAADAGDKLASGIALRLAMTNASYEKYPPRLQSLRRNLDAAGMVDFSNGYCLSVAILQKDATGILKCAQPLATHLASAAVVLADAYERGDPPGVPVDSVQAYRWRLQAGILGDPRSMRLVGRHYAARSKKPGSLAWAVKWYSSASLLGDEFAMLDYAELKSRADAGDVGDPAVAAKMLETIVSSNPPSDVGGRARRDLAGLLAHGRGATRDPARALALLKQDADAGDAMSRIALAELLFSGSVGEPDPAGARQWIERALSGSKPTVAVSVAGRLFHGVTLPADRARAVALWTQAGAQGENLAWNNMGWELCTAPDAALRDPQRGLEAIVKATAKDQHPGWLDTLAACQAATGDFDTALATEQRALAAEEPDTDLAANLRERVEIYRAHRSYVQPPYLNPNDTATDKLPKTDTRK